jgi:uncharacterized protein
MERYHSLGDLPPTLSVFPLSGALLLPRGQLPLNVFEPRYLALVDAAMSGARLIGMIQPTVPEDKILTPPLSAVGCAGRIVSYKETDDGRYLVTLAGICRFRVVEELKTRNPFREVKPDFAPYAADMVTEPPDDFPRERLISALKDYLSRRELNADWRSVMNAPAETLVNALAMLCPFAPAEKQSILEAPGWLERVDTLVVLLEMASVAPQGGSTIN